MKYHLENFAKAYHAERILCNLDSVSAGFSVL